MIVKFLAVSIIIIGLSSLQLCDSYLAAPLRSSRPTIINTRMSDDAWNGEVVSNTNDGRIRGCSITPVEGSMSEYVLEIDGEQADLGKFSDAIYRKITSDAKQQRFQGFRPGTIPPHLLPTYAGFAMDECAREATLEALQQNNIRPFDDARMEFEFDSISILPPKKKGKKKGKKKKKGAVVEEKVEVEEPNWLVFETMKEAIDAGWKVSYTIYHIRCNIKMFLFWIEFTGVLTTVLFFGSLVKLSASWQGT